RAGVTTYLEAGPDTTLTTLTQQTLTTDDRHVHLLHPDAPEPQTLTAALARLHTGGTPVEWAPVLPAATRHTPLPTYAFQRKTYWLADSGSPGDVTAAGLADGEHPILAAITQLPDSDGTLATGL
ncbi:hypothetical protein ACXZ65_39965, partial [Streptomyces aculeolatus]